MMKSKNQIILIIVIVTVALAVFSTLQTGLGNAIVKEIKELFVSDKEVFQNIEGEKEKTEVNLHEGKGSEYVIYIDETRYKMTSTEDGDLITTLEPLGEEFPQVSMEIKQVLDKKPEDLVKEIEAQLKVDFPELREIERVTEPVEGFLLHGLNGNEWDSKVVDLYVISNKKEGSYVIREDYFFEAAEGHGARFYSMLESFEIVN